MVCEVAAFTCSGVERLYTQRYRTQDLTQITDAFWTQWDVRHHDQCPCSFVQKAPKRSRGKHKTHVLGAYISSICILDTDKLAVAKTDLLPSYNDFGNKTLPPRSWSTVNKWIPPWYWVLLGEHACKIPTTDQFFKCSSGTDLFQNGTDEARGYLKRTNSTEFPPWKGQVKALSLPRIYILNTDRSVGSGEKSIHT